MSKFYEPPRDKVIPRIPRNLLLFGPFANRKTSTAATLSEKYPALPSQPPFSVSESHDLSDLFFNCWDDDALLGFPKLGLSAPHLDLSSIKAGDLLDALKDVHADVATEVKKNKTRWIVHDTVSTFDLKLYVKVSQMFDKGGEQRIEKGDEEGQKNASQMLWRAMLAVHKQEFEFYASLKRHDGSQMGNLFLFHSTTKAPAPVRKDSDQYRKSLQELEAKGLQTEGGGKITIRVTGQAWEMYYNRCPIRMYINTKKVNGKDEATIFTQGGHDSVSSDRGGVLNAAEPADFRVILPKFLNIVAGSPTK